MCKRDYIAEESCIIKGPCDKRTDLEEPLNLAGIKPDQQVGRWVLYFLDQHRLEVLIDNVTPMILTEPPGRR